MITLHSFLIFSQYTPGQNKNFQDKVVENNQTKKFNGILKSQENMMRQNSTNRVGEFNHFPQTSNRKTENEKPGCSYGNDQGKFNPNYFNSYSGLDKQERAPHRNPNSDNPTWNRGKSYAINNKKPYQKN